MGMNTLIASQDQPINQHSRFSSKTFLLPYCHTVYCFFSRRGARCPQSIHLDCDCVSCSLHLEYHWHSPVACTEFGQLKIKINRNKHQFKAFSGSASVFAWQGYKIPSLCNALTARSHLAPYHPFSTSYKLTAALGCFRATQVKCKFCDPQSTKRQNHLR